MNNSEASDASSSGTNSQLETWQLRLDRSISTKSFPFFFGPPPQGPSQGPGPPGPPPPQPLRGTPKNTGRPFLALPFSNHPKRGTRYKANTLILPRARRRSDIGQYILDLALACGEAARVLLPSCNSNFCLSTPEETYSEAPPLRTGLMGVAWRKDLNVVSGVQTTTCKE